MRCVEPFVKAGEVYPCGQCLPCKFRAARIWRNRIILEASQHEFTSVATLTYDEASLPEGGELQCDDLRNFLKRLRKRIAERGGARIRFYACGEYGEVGGRPHYHVVLFGYPPCSFGRTARHWCGDCQCVSCLDVARTWPIGAVSLGPFSKECASYVAGYVTRKVLSRAPPGKQSPFTRMSNRPGLGANAMLAVAATMQSYGMETKNLPVALREGKYPMLLGRFLRSKLADALGVDVPAQELSEAMLSVLAYAFAHSTSAKKVFGEINEVYNSQLLQREAYREKIL